MMEFRCKAFAVIVVFLFIWLMSGLVSPPPVQAQSNKFPIEIKWRGHDRVGDSLVKLLKAHIQRSPSLQLIEAQGAQIRLVLISPRWNRPCFNFWQKIASLASTKLHRSMRSFGSHPYPVKCHGILPTKPVCVRPILNSTTWHNS